MLLIHRTLACAALTLGCLFPTTPASAEDLFPPAGGASVVPGRSAAQEAIRELAQARRALLRARMGADQVTRIVESELRTSGPYRDLQRSAAMAAAQFNALRRPVVLGLRREPAFARVAREREEARLMIRQLVDQQKAGYPQILPYARVAMEAGRRLTRAETIALALDPMVEDARAAMTEAYARLRGATLSNRQSLLEHPGVAMAREDVAAARERVADANRQLAAVLTAEARAEAVPRRR